jgi:heterodisulfide reductase subunit A
MMDVGRHPNITLYTLSEVVEVKGEAGNFVVKILKHPRFVNTNQCTACGDCAKVCNIAVPNEFD